MRTNIVDLFFFELDRRLAAPVSVILTGAAAGNLYGNVRASADIDFEIRSKRKAKEREYNEKLENSISEVSSTLGIAANYSDDISRWSMIDYLDYRKTSIPYKKIGRVDIRLLAPEYWTIGKMTRFMEIDVDDVVKVIKKKRLRAAALVTLWARALRASPLSLTKGHFTRNVETFLKIRGKKLWGKSFDPDKMIAHFRKLAGLKISSATS
jgi:hypothetical protein